MATIEKKENPTVSELNKMNMWDTFLLKSMEGLSITRVPGGFLYALRSVGMTFVSTDEFRTV